jgi:TPP-dependent pyruvate/acetoin dehydrogenase alpha subunit
LIFGEMHLGTGEEALITGVVAHVREGDAMALDHRSTAAFLMRGIDRAGLLAELRELGVKGLQEDLTGDELDAATAALVGRGFSRGRGN